MTFIHPIVTQPGSVRSHGRTDQNDGLATLGERGHHRCEESKLNDGELANQHFCQGTARPATARQNTIYRLESAGEHIRDRPAQLVAPPQRSLNGRRKRFMNVGIGVLGWGS